MASLRPVLTCVRACAVAATHTVDALPRAAVYALGHTWMPKTTGEVVPATSAAMRAVHAYSSRAISISSEKVPSTHSKEFLSGRSDEFHDKVKRDSAVPAGSPMEPPEKSATPAGTDERYLEAFVRHLKVSQLLRK